MCVWAVFVFKSLPSLICLKGFVELGAGGDLGVRGEDLLFDVLDARISEDPRAVSLIVGHGETLAARKSVRSCSVFQLNATKRREQRGGGRSKRNEVMRYSEGGGGGSGFGLVLS